MQLANAVLHLLFSTSRANSQLELIVTPLSLMETAESQMIGAY